MAPASADAAMTNHTPPACFMAAKRSHADVMAGTW
jgi:hypothetical protein